MLYGEGVKLVMLKLEIQFGINIQNHRINKLININPFSNNQKSSTFQISDSLRKSSLRSQKQ